MGYIKSLNSLRFFGALTVIFLHLGSYNVFKSYGLENYHVLISGYTGIHLFYVLSGFLITSLAINEFKKSQSFSLKKFFVRRALRLFPLYYLAILVVFVVQLFKLTNVKFESYLYALFYSYNFVPRKFYHGLLGSFHTLATEEHFYLIFAILFVSMSRFGKKHVFYAVPLVFLTGILFLHNFRDWFVDFEKTHYVSRWTLFAIQPILVGCLGGFVFSSPLLSTLKNKFNDNFIKSSLILVFVFAYLIQVVYRNEIVMSISFLSLILFLTLYENTWLNK
ncbi:MAG: acyltransferase, partial [Bdellovibrionales bacterium]|nr:acyltransferase [Bdellovibrionales bacterium]